ncbi:MAG: hypothetical protein HZB36_08145 [Candidatus Omnitrophica bacterium]|nr:hypothetical protein [Candidatus Omnitrophota bacterium]
MGTYSEAIKRSIKAQLDKEEAKKQPLLDAKPSSSGMGIYIWVLGLVLIVLFVSNFIFISKFYALAKDKDTRVARSLENAQQVKEYLEDVKKQLNSVSRELSEFRTTLNLAAQKMKDDSFRFAEVEKRLDGLDFSLHNIIKAKDQLFTRVAQLESKLSSQ